MIDTPLVARDTPARALLAALLLGLLALPAHAVAQPRDLNATVIWVREGRVYLAAPDSGALEPWALLTFVYRGKTVAAGEVVRVLDGELALVRLTSGSLARIKNPKRLRVWGEPARIRALPVLRVGYPGRGRANLLFTCGEVTLDSSRLPRGYRADRVDAHAFRLVRGSESSSPAPWPDTLLIRWFGESADEEIALERGELDAAVFWPGELSAHMREDSRWQAPLFGLRARGALVGAAPGSGSPDDSSAVGFDSLVFAALNRELFRGDLAPWEAGPETPSGGWHAGASHYAVDPALPGQRVLERFLNRGAGPSSAGGDARAVRVFYLDAPIAAPDSLAFGVAEHLNRGAASAQRGAQADSMRARYLFALRLPLVCRRELRPYVSALGTDALVNLPACRSAERAP